LKPIAGDSGISFSGMEAITMARKLQWISLAALSFLVTGCVTSTDKYTAVKLENESLRQQLGEQESKARASQAQADAYKNQLAALMDGSTSTAGLVKNQADQIANLQAQLADINRRYEDALKNAGTGTPLTPEVSNALTQFASQNPDLVDFDAARGIVKFKTDFTFALGSAQLTDKAKSAITRFASILNSQAASQYELMVAGHTDNTPVSNPNTKAAGHHDNWYLSSHRAIAVGSELVKANVSQQRIAVVGYADQRPIASNNTTEGKAQNRRVEVLILPSTVRSGVARTAPKTGTGGRPALNKDTTNTQIAPVDKGPVFNK
jgi:chemotaxis protein MotB